MTTAAETAAGAATTTKTAAAAMATATASDEGDGNSDGDGNGDGDGGGCLGVLSLIIIYHCAKLKIRVEFLMTYVMVKYDT